jgi:hypothetical protein
LLGKTAFSYNFDALHGTSDENLRTLNAILTGLDELKQLLCAAVSIVLIMAFILIIPLLGGKNGWIQSCAQIHSRRRNVQKLFDKID